MGLTAPGHPGYGPLSDSVISGEPFTSRGALMSPLRKVRALVLLALVALTGCETARVVSKDQYGGVVAIPDNSNSWPFYYHDKALALIKKECPDYVIVKEGEVVTGMVTTNRDSTETRNQDLTPRNSRYG